MILLIVYVSGGLLWNFSWTLKGGHRSRDKTRILELEEMRDSEDIPPDSQAEWPLFSCCCCCFAVLFLIQKGQ